MVADEVRFLRNRSQASVGVPSFRDRDNVVAGLPVTARVTVLQGVLDAVEHWSRAGGGVGKRREQSIQYVALEILLQLVRQRELAWGLPNKHVRDQYRGPAVRGESLPRPALQAKAPYLLDLVDWSAIDPWLVGLHYPKEIRKRHQSLREALYERGPFIPNRHLHQYVLHRLHAAWGVTGDSGAPPPGNP